jgi:hypothetical protein
LINQMDEQLKQIEEQLKETGHMVIEDVIGGAQMILIPDHPMTEAECEIAIRALRRTADDLIGSLDKAFEETLVEGLKRRGRSDAEIQSALEDFRKRLSEKLKQ